MVSHTVPEITADVAAMSQIALVGNPAVYRPVDRVHPELRVQVSLLEENRTMLGRPSIIVHDQNSIPLNKLARSINEFISPGTGVSLFYNKELTKRLSTRTSQCDHRPVRIMDHEYKYDRMSSSEIISQFNMAQWKRRHELAGTMVTHVFHAMDPEFKSRTVRRRINRFVDYSGHRGQFSLYLIQPEGLTEMIEEELYSLPKLFSEIGGLSSFCFGFSCILFFELFELAFWLRCTYRSQFTNELNEYLSRGIQMTSDPVEPSPIELDERIGANSISPSDDSQSGGSGRKRRAEKFDRMFSEKENSSVDTDHRVSGIVDLGHLGDTEIETDLRIQSVQSSQIK
ncbi:unnamed protein product [Echinostoma caproni]|uniref:Amiloride-sensitive sodium channel n=1 Tax=Echinostoma caproni TaxID=27848 RepID=A0A183A9X5_9TREM|nr:unnamed protein product [Echinostoma caproni]